MVGLGNQNLYLSFIFGLKQGILINIEIYWRIEL